MHDDPADDARAAGMLTGSVDGRVIAGLTARVATLEADNRRLADRVAALEGLVKGLEWSATHDDSGDLAAVCPACGAVQRLQGRHAPGCRLAAALAGGKT